MIVRKDLEGGLILIGQTDHSRLVGQLAAQWGNERFAAPEPYEAMARVGAFHDYGWLRYETAPLYDATSGGTPEFRQVPSSEQQLEGYQWCCDWLLAGDPYASLIAGMHRTGLWRNRYGAIAHPAGFNPRSPNPMIEAFIARNEARQQDQRKAFDEAQLWTNYRLMQVWDLLGLYFCCAEPGEDHIEPVPTRYGGGKDEGVRLTMKPVGPSRVAFDPYPFAARPFEVQLAHKRLTQARYSDQGAFRRAYFQAPLQLMRFELV